MTLHLLTTDGLFLAQACLPDKSFPGKEEWQEIRLRNAGSDESIRSGLVRRVLYALANLAKPMTAVLANLCELKRSFPAFAAF
jgi:hypothetical protein